MQLALKRCKQYVSLFSYRRNVLSHLYDSFELGGDKKTKGAALQFVSIEIAIDIHHLANHFSPFSDRTFIVHSYVVFIYTICYVANMILCPHKVSAYM